MQRLLTGRFGALPGRRLPCCRQRPLFFDGCRDQVHTRIRHGYAGIRGKYANRSSWPKFSMPSIREFAGNIKGYQSSHKYSQIRGLDIRRYADIRGHSHRFTVTYPRMDSVLELTVEKMFFALSVFCFLQKLMKNHKNQNASTEASISGF